MSQMNGISLVSTAGQFGPVLLPYDDEELCFLKQFGFNTYSVSLF